MAQIKDLQAGTSGDTIPVTAGGTGSATATDARTALSSAKSGANSDITSLTACTSITGLTTPLTIAQGGTGTASTTFANLTTNVTGTLPVANGGTGLATLTANNVMLGNGTSTPSFVAPSTTGNILTSNGTTWASTAPPITTTSGTAPYFGARAFVSFSTITLNNISATYTQSGTTVILTVASHAYIAGHQIFVDITSGTGVDGLYVVTAVTATTITYTAGTSLTTSGNATIKQCSIYTGSQNVANVPYQTTAVFVVNFTTAMPFANYVAVGNCGTNNGGTMQGGDDNVVSFGSSGYAGIRTTQSIRGFTYSSNGSGSEDVSLVNITIFA